MKNSPAGAALVALALLTPSLAAANVALRPIMQRWNHSRRLIDAMLAGRQPYDPVTVTAAVRLYIADARTVSAHVTSKSAEAHDFAARFARFAQDAEAAGAASISVAAFRPHMQRLMGDCSACHAVYKN